MIKHITPRALLTFSCALFGAIVISGCASSGSGGGWIALSDGKSFNGWKINESPQSWSMDNGAFVAKGGRSHLFYVGEHQPFKNFEFEADIMTRSNSNGGIYIHTKYQDSNWPKHGYECQVNNTFVKDPIKTASLYQVVNVTNAPARDDQWFKYNIRVEGKRIVIRIDGKVITDYTEPADKQPGKDFTRVLSEGTFAFQAHDPDSTVYYKNIKVKRLP